MNGLENLSLIDNGTEWTIHQTHTAGYTLIIVDFRPTQLIGSNGIHTAASCTRTLQLIDCTIWTHIHTASAFDAFFLIDVGFSVHHRDRILWTYLLAWMCQTALTRIGYHNRLFRTCIAGKLDNVYQWVIVIFFGDGTLFNTITQGRMLIHSSYRKTDSKTQALTNNGTLQKNRITVSSTFSRDNFKWQLFNTACIISAFIGKAGDFCKDISSYISY